MPSRPYLPTGVLTLDAAADLGWTRAALRHALLRGELVQVFPRVLASSVAFAGDPSLRHAAALAYVGRPSVLSHETAADLHAIAVPRGPRRSATDLVAVHVSVTDRRTIRPQPGLVVHRPLQLDESEATLRNGLCVTSVERTVVDLCAHLSPREASYLIARTVQSGSTSPYRLLAQVERHQRLHGAKRARLSLADLEVGQGSGAEVELLRMVRRWRLPPPETGVVLETPFGRRYPDLFWPTARVACELDGRSYHIDPQDWDNDLARDDALAALGVETVHLSPRALRQEPHRCRDRLTCVLRRRWPNDVPFR